MDAMNSQVQPLPGCHEAAPPVALFKTGTVPIDIGAWGWRRTIRRLERWFAILNQHDCRFPHTCQSIRDRELETARSTKVAAAIRSASTYELPLQSSRLPAPDKPIDVEY